MLRVILFILVLCPVLMVGQTVNGVNYKPVPSLNVKGNEIVRDTLNVDGTIVLSNDAILGSDGDTIFHAGNPNFNAGLEAGDSWTTAVNSVAIGYQASKTATTAGYSTALGYRALYLNTTAPGHWNVGIGAQSGQNITTGTRNTALGSRALLSTTDGGYNVGIGFDALYKNTGGDYNIGIGPNSLYNNTTGNNHVAVGYAAGYSMTTGTDCSALGESALYSNTTGIGNTAIGRRALYYNVDGVQNTALGQSALIDCVDGDGNTALGSYSLGHTTSGSRNTGCGRSSGWYMTTGTDNAYLGWRTGYSNSIGNYNLAAGTYALHWNQTGVNHVSFGYNSGIYVPASTMVSTAVAGAGLDIGEYAYRVSYVLDGVETAMVDGAVNSATTTAGNQQIDLSVIPTYAGPRTCTARKIYRTPVDGEHLYYLVTTIADNVTTTYSDNTADGALGAQIDDIDSCVVIGANVRAYIDNELAIDNENTTSPLISGNFLEDTLTINGILGIRDSIVKQDSSVTYRHSVSIADDESFDLPASAWGFGQVSINGGAEWVHFRFTSAGAVTLVSNTANVVNTDTDANLCVFDGGTYITIRNRLGARYTMLVDITYSIY